MNEHSPEDDLQALRAADPAAAIDAPRALRERVADIPTEALDAEPIPLQRRRRWLLPAAAAAAVVAAIGGGYVWGTGGIDLGPAPSPLAVATGTPDDPAAPIGLGSGNAASDAGARYSAEQGVAGESMDMAVSTDMEYGYGFFGNRQRFSVPTFSSTASEAEVYAVDGRADYAYTAEDASQMAAAMGVTGETTQFERGSGWSVGNHDSGAYLSIYAWSGGSVQYSSGLEDPWSACHNATSQRYVLNGASPETLHAYEAEVQQCIEDTPPPTEEQAREALRAFLTATGVDEEVEITVGNEYDWETGTLRAAASWVVGSNATELVTEVVVSAQGMLYGYGPIGDVVSLGEYPIVSPAEGAARLNDPAYSPTLVSWPEREGEVPPYTPQTAPPEVPAAGSHLPWAIAEHEIVSARLGLALLSGEGGQRFLAPAYEFTASDETVWSVVALAEDALDTTSAETSYGRVFLE